MKRLLSVLSICIFVFACSASKVNLDEQGGEEQIYVFDDVPNVAEDSSAAETVVKTDSVVSEQPAATADFIYFIQVGAFSTRERAERFKLFNQNKINYPLDISFSSEVDLWVVRLPKFNTKSEAEKVRDEIWKVQEFKDAFIVTVQE